MSWFDLVFFLSSSRFSWKYLPPCFCPMTWGAFAQFNRGQHKEPSQRQILGRQASSLLISFWNAIGGEVQRGWTSGFLIQWVLIRRQRERMWGVFNWDWNAPTLYKWAYCSSPLTDGSIGVTWHHYKILDLISCVIWSTCINQAWLSVCFCV